MTDTADNGRRSASPDKQDSLVFYGHPESGHSYKVALYLALAEITHSYHQVDIFAPRTHRRRSFQTVSRFGEVPVLVVGGQAISQSNAILLWLAAHFDRFAGRTPSENIAINEWLFWEMSRLSLGVANLRYLRRFEIDPAHDLLDHYRMRSLSALGTLNEVLGVTGFLVGKEPTIADLSCCGYLYWLGEAGIEINNYSNIERWLENIARLPNWRSPADLLGTVVPTLTGA